MHLQCSRGTSDPPITFLVCFVVLIIHNKISTKPSFFNFRAFHVTSSEWNNVLGLFKDIFRTVLEHLFQTCLKQTFRTVIENF